MGKLWKIQYIERTCYEITAFPTPSPVVFIDTAPCNNNAFVLPCTLPTCNCALPTNYPCHGTGDPAANPCYDDCVIVNSTVAGPVDLGATSDVCVHVTRWGTITGATAIVGSSNADCIM